MKTPSEELPGAVEARGKTYRGIAGLFSDVERKIIFRKYLAALGWTEIVILIGCWLYHMGTEGYDAHGPINIQFPWRFYFAVAFMAPVAITFLLGTVIAGFNKYFSVSEGTREESPGAGDGAAPGDAPGWVRNASEVLILFRKLPFLGLLLLLSVGVCFLYNIEAIFAFIENVGEKSVKIALVSAGVVAGIAVVFGLVLIFLNYRLRARSMEYRYKSEMAERFGLVILEDNTVLNGRGKLLVQGKKWKKEVVTLLPSGYCDPADSAVEEERREAVPRPAAIDYGAS